MFGNRQSAIRAIFSMNSQCHSFQYEGSLLLRDMTIQLQKFIFPYVKNKHIMPIDCSTKLYLM